MDSTNINSTVSTTDSTYFTESSNNATHFKNKDFTNVSRIFDDVKTSENSKGQIFICPIASSLSRLKGLDEFSGDFLQLDSDISKDKILAFYKQEFFNVCDYCRDMWEQGESIVPALQTDNVLTIKENTKTSQNVI